MKNKWVTYGFLFLLVIALTSLAVLQFHWLDSVSKAEKDRLEENLSAATENFVADFSRIFEEMNQIFRLQVTNQEDNYEELFSASYSNWQTVSNYPSLVDSIFYIKGWNEDPEVYFFSTDPGILQPIEPSVSVYEWLEDYSEKYSGKAHELRVKADPDLGNPSFIAVSVQSLDVVTLLDGNSGNDIRLSLNVNQLDNIVLIRLNDKTLKEEMIPDIASTYFSESYKDQYQLSLVNPAIEDSVYYSSLENGILPNPDFRRTLRKPGLSSLMIVNDKFGVQNSFPKFALLDSMNLDINSIRVNSRATQSSEFSYITNSDSTSSYAHFFSDSTSSSLPLNASVLSQLAHNYWEIWLSFKAGSLDAFVNKTRNRNLLISFGILLILGISGAMIVIFSHRLKDLADQQMLFVAGVSHELRTPITVIRSAAENLSEGLIQDKKRREKYSELMLKEGRRLSNMVDQIMEFSGIQSGKKIYQFNPMVVEELLEHIKSETEPLLKENDMKLEYSISTRKENITADFEGLFIAIMNLIQNAIKFSPACEIIKFRIDDIQWRGQEAIQVQVQDFGHGIPESEHRDIFKPFFRGTKSVEDQIRGNGIGLSLVKKIAEAHQGVVTVKSKKGEGAIFKFIIPVVK